FAASVDCSGPRLATAVVAGLRPATNRQVTGVRSVWGTHSTEYWATTRKRLATLTDKVASTREGPSSGGRGHRESGPPRGVAVHDEFQNVDDGLPAGAFQEGD